MKKSKSSALSVILALLSIWIFGAIPAQASGGSFTNNLDTHLASGLVVPSSYETSAEGLVCFNLTGGNYRYLYTSNVQLVYEFGVETYTDTFDYSIAKTNDVYPMCLTPTLGADFSNATNVRINGVVHVSTELAPSFATYLATKGITSVSVWSNYYQNKTVFDFTFSNPSGKPLVYAISDFKIDNLTAAGAPAFLVVPAKSDAVIYGISLPGDYTQDIPNLAVSANLTAKKLTTVKMKRIKLPKGLKLVSNAPELWNYPGYNENQVGQKVTTPCLKLKNTLKKSVSVKAALTWVTGKEKLKGTYGEIITIAPGVTQCVAGLDSNDNYFLKDVRVGKKTTLSGSIKVVKPSTVSTANLQLNGYSVTQPAWLSFDAATKTTKIFLYVANPNTFQNAVLSNPTLNGVALAGPAVGGGCECGGPGYDPHTRTVQVKKIKGDVRVGKTLALGGSMSSSPDVSVVMNSDLTGGDGAYGCTAYHLEAFNEYDSDANVTDVKLNCYNMTDVVRNLNLTNLVITATENGMPTQTYRVLPSAQIVTLKPNASWVGVTIFRAIGDWRTGQKTLTFDGLTYTQ